MSPNSLLCMVLSAVVLVDHSRSSLIDTCPEQYTIERTYSDKKTIINVLSNNKVCERISREETYETVSNYDLLPQRSLVKKNGEYYLSFTWRAMVVDGKFPKMFLLFLNYSIPEFNVTNQFECVILKLRRRKAADSEVSSYFSFDCIKLLDIPEERAGTVAIQIWNYFQKQVNGQCRHRRAVSHTNTCKTVECSSQRHFSLSREIYETEICSCYHLHNGKPKVISEHIINRNTIAFSGTVENLPDFIGILNLTIWRDNKIIWHSEFDNAKLFQNTSVQFLTNRLKRNPGKYSLTIILRCRSRSRDNRHYMMSGCQIQSSDDHFLYEMKVEVESPNSSYLNGGVSLILIGFLAILLVTLVVTVAVFVCYKQRKSTSKDELNSSRPSRAVLNSSKDLAKNAEASVLLPDTTEANRVNLQTQSALLLCHPYDLGPILRKLFLTLDVSLQNGRDQNWREFAVEALSNNYNIVILLSEGLLDLISEYGSKRTVRLVERQYENVPGIVLKDLETLIKSNPSHTANFLHIVAPSGEEGNTLVQRLFERYDFIKSMNNYCVYFISEDSQLNESSISDLVRLKSNLRIGRSSTSQINTEVLQDGRRESCTAIT